MIAVDSKELRSSLDTLKAAILNAGAQAVRMAAGDAADHAKKTSLFHDRTGATRASIERNFFHLRAEVIASGAAHWLENGTKPHRIAPKHAKVLRFVAHGSTRFAHGVNHPGTEARPFMTEARDLGAKSLEYGLAYLTDQAISRMRG